MKTKDTVLEFLREKGVPNVQDKDTWFVEWKNGFQIDLVELFEEFADHICVQSEGVSEKKISKYDAFISFLNKEGYTVTMANPDHVPGQGYSPAPFYRNVNIDFAITEFQKQFHHPQPISEEELIHFFKWCEKHHFINPTGDYKKVITAYRKQKE